MVRYYFHFTDLKHDTSDRGLELQDDEAAWRETALVAYDLWGGSADRRKWKDWTVRVTDDSGRHVIGVSLEARDQGSN